MKPKSPQDGSVVSHQIRIEICPAGRWAYEGPEFPVFGIHALGDELVLHTVVRKTRARTEGLTDEVVEQIIRSTWVIDHIEQEVHPDLRSTVYYVAFNKPAEVVVAA